jgi:hypothetical protein
MSLRTVEKIKGRERDNNECDRFGLGRTRGEEFLRKEKSKESQLRDNLHRRTQSNIFRLTTLD